MTTTLVESAAALAPELRAAVRDLVLVLADSKRLLGFRYGGWILGAPELETGIACAAMAQDEWGHARLMYALLKDFGDDVERLEHARPPGEYRSMAVLDREPEDWAGVVALNLLADGALTVQIAAFRDCCYLPLRQRTEKLLAEERYHQAHGVAWARRYATGAPAARDAFAATARTLLPAVLAWFGPAGAQADALAEAGICDAGPDELRRRFLALNAAVLEPLGIDPRAPALAPDFRDFDEERRRSRRPGEPAGDGPDAETITRVRGDRNRAFLVDA